MRRVRRVMSLCLILPWSRIKIRGLFRFISLRILCLGFCISHDVFIVSCGIYIRTDDL